MDAQHHRTLGDYLRVLRAQRVIMIAVPLLALLMVVIYSVTKTPVYEASASLAFKDESQDLGVLGTPSAPNQDPAKFAAARAETITSQRVLRGVKTGVGGNESVGELRDTVSQQVEPNSDLVVITAQASSARRASQVADEFANQTRSVVTNTERARYSNAAARLRVQFKDAERRKDRTAVLALADRISRLVSLSSFATPVEVTEVAETPESPSSPRPVRDVMFALFLGLILASALAFLREALDRRLRTPNEIDEQLGLPMLGFVRDEAMGHVVQSANGAPLLEASDFEGFKIIKTNLDFLDVDSPPSSVLVTSAAPEEGKSTVAASLAFAWAAAGKNTLLVECDLRRPTLAKRLGLESRPGLTDWLGRVAEPKEILQPLNAGFASSANGGGAAQAGSLVCITAGTPSPQPAELLGSQRCQAFLEEVTAYYDRVVIDTSPLLSVVDTLELIPQVEGVVLCVRITRTTRDQVRAARAAMGHFPDRPTGLVVTGMRRRDWGDYGYYGYPAYGYSATPEPAKS